MNIFSGMTTDGLEEVGDRLGGGGVVDTDLYIGTIKLAYAGKSPTSSSQSVNFLIDINGFEYRETFYVVGRSGNNYYLDKKDPSKKIPIPGFVAVDNICLVTTGKSLTEQTIEEKTVSLYDYDAKKEIPQNVPVLVDLLGQSVTLGIVKQVVDKNVKDSSGNYVASGETREENIIDAVFHTESGFTVAEARAQKAVPEFKDRWVAKNKGKVINRAKGAAGKTGAPGRPGAAPGAAPSAPKPTTSLFGS